MRQAARRRVVSATTLSIVALLATLLTALATITTSGDASSATESAARGAPSPLGGAPGLADADPNRIIGGAVPGVPKEGTIISGAKSLLQLKQDLSSVLQESDLVGLIGAQAERNAVMVAALEQKMHRETGALGARCVRACMRERACALLVPW